MHARRRRPAADRRMEATCAPRRPPYVSSAGFSISSACSHLPARPPQGATLPSINRSARAPRGGIQFFFQQARDCASRTALTAEPHIQQERETEAAESMAEGKANCIDILIAILLPPLGVFLKHGCGHEFWICLLLTFLGYIPGIIYAVYAITK
ncbi:hypothetical protein PVAP13_3KG138500 [Panicum virgatum]|uniref:Uncharacterized protein n=1 Tax=Panicum virgatum TaxID=38727 RepID=A0A8T0UIW9_PANVG|nr:hypothetical protein PVAP13_3KG138500 [Panicum virgatum]